MGSALLTQTTRDDAHHGTLIPAGSTNEALRVQVAERLAAHRLRREGAPDTSAASSSPAQPHLARATGQKARIAAAVAERYAEAQTYRAFLAAEAERTVQQARAAAEIAARNAQAIAQAQQHLLDSLARQQAEEPHPAPHAGSHTLQLDSPDPMLWPELEPASHSPSRETTHGLGRSATRPRARAARQQPPSTAPAVESNRAEPTPHAPESSMRIVLFEELRSKQSPFAAQRAVHPRDDHEALALDAEISFRHAPVFEEPAGPPTPLPANLIEFPRQLVASRKARPRYAEGPLREEDDARAEGSQLRIFEVDPAQISTVADPSEPDETPAPQWTSLWLDTPSGTPQAAHVPQPGDLSLGADTLPYAAPPARPLTARTSRRLMAAGIDTALTTTAALLFALAFTVCAGHLAGPAAGWSSAVIINGAETALDGLPLASEFAVVATATGVLALAYQLLFFTFSCATPGMRFARIGLCTFSDDNPTRRAMRLRVLALVLSTVTLGLGHLWVLLDEDRLTWHDLISRMYPRSY